MQKQIGMLSAIIVIGSSFSITYGEEYEIPDWIKEIAGFWYEEKITDSEFAEGIAYLIENEIIQISEMEKLKEENQKLRAEKVALTYEIEELKTGEVSNLRISLHTNKSSYEANDDIMIFGTVSHLVENHQVGIVISDSSGKILAVANISPNIDGSYGFIAKEPIFKEFGEYTVNVYYGGAAYAHTTYTYNPV